MLLAGAARSDREHRRRLALAQVVADGLAREGGLVAERAEHVVAELEGIAEGKAVGGERGRELAEASGERRAEMQRPLDRVLAGLVPGDALRSQAGSSVPRAVPTMSRYWPTLSSMRSSCHTAIASAFDAGRN